MSVSKCCISGFTWSGTPSGRTGKLANNDVYIAGDNPDIAILFIADLFGWKFPNKFDQLDLKGFTARNGREQREGEIFRTARALKRDLGFKKVGAVGYCYGGWASFRLGAKEHAEQGQPLVDCISIGHPSWFTKKDIDEVSVPVQILAPEIDPAYPAEMKSYTFEALQRVNLPFEYRHFPGVVHACFIRGDENKPGERDAMIKGKNAAVSWFTQYLKNA
ncbi:hypothetical protein BDW75DRAFT_233798 [Aspergillus navahoensis]